MNTPIGNEVVMKKTILTLLVICVVGSMAMSQARPNGEQAAKASSPQPLTPVSPPQSAAPKDTPAKQAGQNAAVASDDFIIGSEDVLEVKVWREPDFTTHAVVRPDGKFGVTLLGDIQASGLTTAQLTESIAAKLKRFLEEPEVSVVVVEIHSQMVHL